MADKKIYNQKRASARAALDRVCTFIDVYVPDVISVEDLTIRLEMLEKTLSEFKEAEDTLLTFDGVDSELPEFELKYFSAKAALRKLIKKSTVDATESLSKTMMTFTEQQREFFNSFSDRSFQLPSTSDVCLPKLNIPPFTGSYAEFPSFKDLYETSVHNSTAISNVHKFQYLKSLLRDEASALVRHIQVTDINYSQAWEKIVNRYDKKRHVIHSHIKNFMEQPVITQLSPKAIRKIYDTSDEAIRGLRALGDEAEKRDPWLIFILLQKLDSDTRQLWSQDSVENDFPSLENFLQFLTRRCDALESCELLTKRSSTIRPPIKSHNLITRSTLQCPKCNEDHYLHNCQQFKNLDVLQRKEFVQSHNLCFNCFSNSHQVQTCYSRYSCHQCRRRHHTLLHQLNSLQVNTAQASEDSINIQSSLTSVNDSTEVPHNIQSYHANVQSPSTSIQHINKEKPNFHALLPTAVVQVRDNQGNSHLCRVLLDCGSQASFIAESFVQRLQIARYNARIPISGLASNNTTTKGWTSVMISARGDNLNYFKVNVLIVPQVTSSIPHKMIDVSKWGLADNLPLADPNYNHPANIDMLIGADHFFNILKDGRRSGTVGSVVAQNTIFGWVISGDVDGNQSNSSTYFSDSIANYHIHCNIDEILKNFWEYEEVEATTPQCIAKDECETHYVQNFSRDTTGRYVVKLPFKQDHKPLGYTSNIAISRLKSIERKLNKNLDLKEEYKTFMQEYQDLGHMEPLKHDEIYQCPENHYYLPHHAVIKCNSSTTKVRVVFDASCKSTSGVSLNDNLMVGPTIQNDLQTVLLQFRKFKIAFSSDIEKMYRQIRIASEDANFQRIVWRENSDSPIQHFKLTTVTYGTASAPYLAIRTLQQLAIDYASEYSLAAEIILKGFYVDDVLFGAETEEEAIQLKDQLIKLLSQGHFILRKWRSNSTKLINTIPEELQSTVNTASFEDNKSEKILGLQWNPVTDNFSFQVVESSNLSPTKRSFLSEAARIFDPLGWLAPATITVKIMFQQLWVQRIGWDDVLPEHLKKRWLALRDEFSEFEKLRIPRCINHFNNLIQLHCFSDASEVAYSAVIYCRDQDENGDTNVRLIASKTKVAPLKQISLPRLELCGAHLLAKLLKRIQTTLNYTDAKCYAWTDSTVVLGWLSDHPRRWKTYIANRTSQILDIIPSTNWNHVKSSDNPADHASRGVYPHKLLHLEQWWNGPSWLHQPESTWPINNNYCVDNIALREEERPNSTLFNHVKTLTTVIEELMSKISSYPKLLRILCYCSRFCHNIRAKRNNLPINTSYLKREELSHANNLCITWAQNTEFQQEITELLQQKQLSSKNKLTSLAPFVDRDGVLRVGGRLENADCSYDSKHPIILPKSHPFSNMIIEYTHLKYFHPGPTLLFHLLRQKFWIIDAKNLIRHHVRKCVVCIRYKGQTSRQLMGNLPTSRVNPARAFSSCGVDYAGPIMLASKKGRGARLIKGYICVFVCFITKAVHLEVASDLTTEAFLAALRRFIARRGIPSDIYSDNATNFVGAKRKLPELYGLIHNSHHNQKISDYLTINGTNWHLIPPAAPNFGGLWESSVKSVKHHLLRSTLNSHFTFEEMSTFLCQIEAILNSRPLTAINSDSSNIDVLTPGHFLMLTAPTALPENGLENVPISRLSRWQNIQQRVSGLWKRYQQEYLNSLQQRHKWKTTQDNLKEGDVVLVKEDNLPPCQWALAKITELHPGTDGLVRVVTLKTSTSVIKRALSKICKLPVN